MSLYYRDPGFIPIIEAKNKMIDKLTKSVAQIGENITNTKPGNVTYMTFEQILRQESEKK